MKIVSLLLLSQTKAFQMPIPKTTSVRLNLSASTEALTPAINVINELNGEIEPKLEMLREKPYFRLYSVDMLGSCEYMPQELFECYSETCEIYPVDEEEVSDICWHKTFVLCFDFLYLIPCFFILPLYLII